MTTSPPPLDASAAPAARKPSGIGLNGGIVAGVVALALVAWFVVVPWLSAPATTTTRVPDIITQPTWSDPVHLVWQTGSGVLDLTDTMTGDIAVVSSYEADGLAGIDLKGGKVLWQMRGSLLNPGPDTSHGLVVSVRGELPTTLNRIDPTTGDVTATMLLGSTEDMAHATRDSVLVYDASRGILCDRVWGGSGCRWEAPADDTCGHGMFTWGSAPWVTTCSGVIDGRTGKPAPFGSDAGVRTGVSVMYYDVSGHTVRVSQSGSGTTYQLWDTAKDKGIGSSAITGGGNAELWGLDAALFMASSADRPGITGYSWTDFTMQWSVPTESRYPTAVSLRGTTAIQDDSDNRLIAVATKTGQLVGHLDNVSIVNAGSRVVYLHDDVTQALLAYDGSSTTFAKLWQIDQPAGMWGSSTGSAVRYAAASGHIVAYQYNYGTGAAQLWVLKG